ncbi:MAG TPA: type II toxin-antitoxin system Phd/YefM family antitoxin [Jiangellaceae bacterium]
MARWQVQEAKQRLSELLKSAHEDGPQVITRHGEEIAVVLDMHEYRRLRGPKITFKDLLTSGPLDVPELELQRSDAPSRVVEL